MDLSVLHPFALLFRPRISLIQSAPPYSALQARRENADRWSKGTIHAALSVRRSTEGLARSTLPHLFVRSFVRSLTRSLARTTRRH